MNKCADCRHAVIEPPTHPMKGWVRCLTEPEIELVVSVRTVRGRRVQDTRWMRPARWHSPVREHDCGRWEGV